MSAVLTRCGYCRAELPENIRGSPYCEKCRANQQKYGKPTHCRYCMLLAAFRDNKCVHCAYAERKHGPPVPCSACKSVSAFQRHPEKTTVLCRLCSMQRPKDKRKSSSNAASTSAKPTSSAQKRRSSTSHASGPASKHPHHGGNAPIASASSSSGFSAIPAAPPPPSTDVLAVQQLKDQILELRKQLSAKDTEMMERDKTIAGLRSDLEFAKRQGRERTQQLLKDKEAAVQAVHEHYRRVAKPSRESTKSNSSTAVADDRPPLL